MKEFPNLKLIGTSHISKDSKTRIIKGFNELKPDIICLELDRQRLHGLLDKNRKRPGLAAIKEIGITGYLFTIIGGYLQKKLGKVTGMAPGDEMLLGSKLAKNNNLRLELIDRDIKITLKKINKIPFRERLKIIGDIIKAPFSRKKVKINIAKIPDEKLVEQLTNQLKTRYPYIYRVVIDERNKFMAKKIFLLMRDNPQKRILAIMGEGHIMGVREQLKKLDDSNVSFIKY